MIKNAKIRGIGLDIIEIKKFKKGIKNIFLKKYFTERERKYCSSFKSRAPRLAGHFAAKEAVVKACGGKLYIGDIEIRHNKSGSPEIWIKNNRDKNFLISISHIEELACAIAVKI